MSTGVIFIAVQLILRDQAVCQDLHSFPTRRSSDLVQSPVVESNLVECAAPTAVLSGRLSPNAQISGAEQLTIDVVPHNKSLVGKHGNEATGTPHRDKVPLVFRQSRVGEIG